MVVFEALNALHGDCLLLRLPKKGGGETLWLIDGGPKTTMPPRKTKTMTPWKDVLLPRLEKLSGEVPTRVSLGVCTHIDDDHIYGMQKLTEEIRNATPADPAHVKFDRFWFNSFDALAPTPAAAPERASTQAVKASLGGAMDEFGRGSAFVESIPQGNQLAGDLVAIGLSGNALTGGLVQARPGTKPVSLDDAEITILGPRAKRLERLRDEWAKAMAIPDAGARKAAVQALFLPKSKTDDSFPNLSSIVLLVKVGGHSLLLTGDAHGDDVVDAWREDLGHDETPVAVDVLKLPHHASRRNVTEKLLDAFPANHYVVSASGKYENPDPQVIEAIVKKFGAKDIMIHFTNGDIVWTKPYALEGGAKATVSKLPDLLAELRKCYPGNWKTNIRGENDFGISIELK